MSLNDITTILGIVYSVSDLTLLILNYLRDKLNFRWFEMGYACDIQSYL